MHKMRSFVVSIVSFVIIGTMFFGQTIATAQDNATQSNSTSGFSYDYTSESLNFSMIFPENWEIIKNTGGLEIFAQPKEKSIPTKEKPVVADPNITVAASMNPIPIDERSLEEYGAQIQTGLRNAVGEESGLEMFMKKIVDVSDSRKGLLYYLRYSKGNYQVFNAILVVSSESHVFRVTLTDYEVTFDANLERLYPFMASINIGTGMIVRPSILELSLPWLATFIGLLVVLLGGRLVMLRIAQNRLTSDLSASAYESESSVAPMSRAVQFKTGSGSVYDPEFRESHEVSGYGGDLTEVPLSQALGEDPSNYSNRGPRRSVTDPESEFGMGAASSIAMSRADDEMPTKRVPTKAPPPPPAPKAANKVPAAPEAKPAKVTPPPLAKSPIVAPPPPVPKPADKAPVVPDAKPVKGPPPPSTKASGKGEPDPSAMSRLGSSAPTSPQTEFGFTRAPDEDDV